MSTSWMELKSMEQLVLDLRGTGKDVSEEIESLRHLLLQVEALPDAQEAICYHGALALVNEFDGLNDTAVHHRRIEIRKIERLHELARQNLVDRPALKDYEKDDLELRRRVLRDLEGRATL